MARSGIQTVVTFDEHVLKIAQGKLSRPRPLLLALTAKKISGASDEQISGILRQAVAALPHKVRDVEILLPRHLAILRQIELPSHDEAEIRELAAFQAAKQTPYSLDEIVLDILILEKNATEFSKVLLIAVQKETAHRALHIAQNAGLTVHALRLSTQGHEAAFLGSASKQAAEIAGTAGLISMDYARTHVVLFSNGVSRFSRSIPLGIKNCEGAADAKAAFAQKLADELEMSFNIYRRENPNAQIRKLWFEPAATPALRDTLLREGYGEPQVFDPGQSMENTAQARVDVEKGLEIIKSDVLGPLILPQHMTLDLLPEDFKRQRTAAHRRRNLIQTAIFFCAFLTLCLAYYAQKVVDKKLYLHQMGKKMETIQAKASQLEQRREKIELIASMARKQGEVTRAIQELYELIPLTVSLSSLSYERGRTLVIKGTAKDMSDVFKLTPALEKSPCFVNVTSQYASKRQVQGQEYTDFQLQCFLSAGDADNTPKKREQPPS